jgi:hypothetical protein
MPPKAKTEPKPAEAAADEAANTPLVFTFRGKEFSIPREILASARVRAVIARGNHFDLIREILAGDPANFDLFLSVVKVGEPENEPLAEFFEAFNAAVGVGNSSPS